MRARPSYTRFARNAAPPPEAYACHARMTPKAAPSPPPKLRRRPAPPAPPPPRREPRHLRATPRRDIFEAVWALFCSVRFAVVLILLLAAATTLGTLIPAGQPRPARLPAGLRRLPEPAPMPASARWPGLMDWAGHVRPLQQLLVPPADHPDLLQHHHLHAEPLGADPAADQPADGPQQRGVLAAA